MRGCQLSVAVGAGGAEPAALRATARSSERRCPRLPRHRSARTSRHAGASAHEQRRRTPTLAGRARGGTAGLLSSTASCCLGRRSHTARARTELQPVVNSWGPADPQRWHSVRCTRLGLGSHSTCARTTRRSGHRTLAPSPSGRRKHSWAGTGAAKAFETFAQRRLVRVAAKFAGKFAREGRARAACET
eukprot:scaffold31598_cov78-Phaeocystis_antarctica.AAC.1